MINFCLTSLEKRARYDRSKEEDCSNGINPLSYIYSESNFNKLKSLLNKYLTFLIEEKNLNSINDITLDDTQEFIDKYYSHWSKKNVSTIIYYLKNISCILNYCLPNDFNRIDLYDLKNPHCNSHNLLEEEFIPIKSLIIDYCALTSDRRYYTVFWLAFNYGLKFDEILQLKLSDINIEKRCITIKNSYKNDKRIIHIFEEDIIYLKELIAIAKDKNWKTVCGNLNSRSFNSFIYSLMKLADKEFITVNDLEFYIRRDFTYRQFTKLTKNYPKEITMSLIRSIWTIICLYLGIDYRSKLLFDSFINEEFLERLYGQKSLSK